MESEHDYPVAATVGGGTHVCCSPRYGRSCESHAGHPVNWCASCLTRLRASCGDLRAELATTRDALAESRGFISKLTFAGNSLYARATTKHAKAAGVRETRRGWAKLIKAIEEPTDGE